MTIVAEVLLRDVHPAEVVLPDGSILKGARAFVTTRRVLIFTVNSEREIELAADLDVTEPDIVPPSRATLGPSETIEVRTPAGTAWVNKGHGCGCGSPLKAMDPPVGWTAPR